MRSRSVQIALSRCINVGGHKAVAMSELRNLLAQLGLLDVRSLLQSGNLVFRCDARTSAGLERTLEIEAEKRLNLQTEYRHPSEIDPLVPANAAS